MSYKIKMVPPDLTVTVVTVVVGTSGVLAWTPPVFKPISYLRFYNSSASGNISITRATTVGTAATVNGPGTVTLAPGQFEAWVAPGPIPANTVWAVASAASTNLTIEYA